MESQDLVERGTILRATVGSTVHGLHHGGQADDGIRGGLYGFEHYVERTQPEGMRSGPGDLDLVAYSLRKYVRLALKGHPTILLLLFVPAELVLVTTEAGEELPLCSRKELDAATSVTSAVRRNACSAHAARSA